VDVMQAVEMIRRKFAESHDTAQIRSSRRVFHRQGHGGRDPG
jgi:hypothetical protein